MNKIGLSIPPILLTNKTICDNVSRNNIYVTIIYTPNNLSGKYFKLVEAFLIVVVSQNVFSTEIDNPFFYKVFQLAPGVVVLR